MHQFQRDSVRIAGGWDKYCMYHHNSMNDGGMSAAATRPTTINRNKRANGTSLGQKVNLKGSIKEIE